MLHSKNKGSETLLILLPPKNSAGEKREFSKFRIYMPNTYRAAANLAFAADLMMAFPGVCAGVTGLLPPPSEPLVISSEFTLTDEGITDLPLFRKLEPLEAMVPAEPTEYPSQVPPLLCCIFHQTLSRLFSPPISVDEVHLGVFDHMFSIF
jgi:hypothetical protein